MKIGRDREQRGHRTRNIDHCNFLTLNEFVGFGTHKTIRHKRLSDRLSFIEKFIYFKKIHILMKLVGICQNLLKLMLTAVKTSEKS